MMKYVTLADGNGGYYMRRLIRDLFHAHLSNPLLDIETDAVGLPALGGELVMTTDSFTVQPLEYPGGDIGSLAIHGTVNDLAVSGALPRYLSLCSILEEGLPIETLERITRSMAGAARSAGVVIVCGDTKVVPRNEASGVYFSVTGIGERQPGLSLAMNNIRAGDRILVSGPVGDHGATVILAREEYGLRGDLSSDSQSVAPLCQALYDLPGIRFMRDPTRGGLATVLNEIRQATGIGITINEQQVPVSEPVNAVCDILGYDPLYLACEGRVVAVIAPSDADEALSRWQALDGGRHATLIGEMDSTQANVVIKTELGGERILAELEDDPLPRIC